MLDTALGIEDTVEKERKKNPSPQRVYIIVREVDSGQDNRLEGEH